MGVMSHIFGVTRSVKQMTGRALCAGVFAGIVMLGGGAAAWGQYRLDHIPDGPPIDAGNPEIVEKPNAQLPLDLEFTRSDGTKVKLGSIFSGKKPVIVSMVYFSCPSLCGFTQEALVNSVKEGPWVLKLGENYDILVVSIDPDDTPEAAATKRSNFLQKMDRPESQVGFTYLTGSVDNIRTLADTIGFGYRRNREGGEKFLHSGGIFVCTPDGHVSQTILGITYTQDTMRQALTLAANGKIGAGFLDTVALSCGAMRFDPNTGKYVHNPWFWAGTAGGAASIAFMAIFMGVMWRGEWKKKHPATGSSAGEEAAASTAETTDSETEA